MKHSADTTPKPQCEPDRPTLVDLPLRRATKAPVRNHLSHTAQGAVLCMIGVLSPLPPSARSCPLPSVSPWKENGGSGVALSPITKHLLHLGSCLSLRRVSVTGCPRKDCTEGRILPAVCYGASGISPNCPRLASQPI